MEDEEHMITPAQSGAGVQQEANEDLPLLVGQEEEDPGTRQSSAVSAGRVHVHGASDDAPSYSPRLTPVDDDVDVAGDGAVMANVSTVVVNGDGRGSGEDMEMAPRPSPGSKYINKDTQGPVNDLATLIADDSAMKRSDSSDVLRLTLHQCARDGDPDSMRRLLSSLAGHPSIKKKINFHDDEDLSALHYAARYNHYNVVKMLVEAGADVNDTDKEGGSPLHFAARYKRMRLARVGIQDSNTEESNYSLNRKALESRVLFEEDDPNATTPTVGDSTIDNSVILYMVHSGANVNAKDIYGCTPLHFAAMRGNEVACKELLSCREVAIEAIDKQQMTALHLAASHNEVEIVRMLIESNANLRCCDEDMGTPLHFACMEGSEEVVRMLFEAGEKQDGWVTVAQMVSDQDNQQNSPLHLAVENRSLEVAKLCIEKNADVNVPRNNFQTPLHLAAQAGELNIVKLLVEHHARVDALDIYQQAPIHKACAFNYPDVIEYLWRRGAKLNRHDKDNFSPLLIAASNGHAKAIKTLLKCGAKIEEQDKNDKTALYWAAAEDNVEALQVLLAHPRSRVLMDMSDRYDNTPLHTAAENGYLGIVKALLESGADMDAKNEEEQTPLHLAASNGKTNVVRELMRINKMVINDEDEDSNTALHLAALNGHNKVTIALVEIGADIEARNCFLWTPLDCAASKGHVKVCRTLLEADAPVDPMDKTKTTPLHLASRNGHNPVVALLLENNANVTQRDSDGNNCLDLAIDSGHKDVALGIVNSSKWREALMNETLDLNTTRRVTPMRKLIRKMPDVAEVVFNKCTTSNMTNPDHPNYEINFNYEFLDDTYANWRDIDTASDALSSAGSIYEENDRLKSDVQPYSKDTTVLKNNHPLMIMVTTKQEDLLAHPLVTSLLRQKWNKFGRVVYYTNLLIYCIFLAFLTGYVIVSKAPYDYTNKVLVIPKNMTECEYLKANYLHVWGESSWPKTLFIDIGRFVIMGLAVFNLLREILQILTSPLAYISKLENFMEWVLYVCTIIFVIDINECQQGTGIRLNWQWQIGAVAIFLAWMDLVLFIRKVPRFGIYVVMFTDILWTFTQFFPVFILFIFAFAMAFFALLKNQYEFRSVGASLLKTSVMMIGEIEFGDVFLSTETSQSYGDQIIYEALTYIIFVLFLILMTVIIMNLLVGLAVDDIKAVQEQAVLKRLAMQVELALDVEALLPHFARKRTMLRCSKIRPNDDTTSLRKFLHIESSTLSATAISKALNPDLDEMEQLQENQDKMMTQIYNLRQRMKTMAEQNLRLENMIGAVLTHHNISLDEEDVTVEA